MSFILVSAPAAADKGDYLAGLGLDGDSAGGRAISLFGDYGASDSAWLSSSASFTRTKGVVDFDAVYVDVAVDYLFDPVGVRLGAAYWGDPDLFDSVDLRGSVYWSSERLSISGDYERRAFDFTFQPLQSDRERTVEFHADGIGLNASFETSKNTSLYFGGMDYEYSVNIRLQENIDVLRFLSISRLSLINSLVDKQVSGGMNLRWGPRSIDFNVSAWRTEVDQGRVLSYGIGFTTPIDDFSDLQLRLAYDDSENFGDTWVFSVSLYTFGSPDL